MILILKLIIITLDLLIAIKTPLIHNISVELILTLLRFVDRRKMAD